MIPRKLVVLALPLLAVLPITVSAQQSHTPTPTDVARSYFEAMDSKKLEAAEVLFADSSSIFESGGEEGDWKHYRAHHIGAELDAIKSFETTLGQPEEELSTDGTMAFVAWPIEYHIVLQNDKEIDSQGTVTFVLTRSNEHFKIRHLHWSSRPLKKKQE